MLASIHNEVSKQTIAFPELSNKTSDRFYQTADSMQLTDKAFKPKAPFSKTKMSPVTSPKRFKKN
jgi:hypothetical protein